MINKFLLALFLLFPTLLFADTDIQSFAKAKGAQSTTANTEVSLIAASGSTMYRTIITSCQVANTGGSTSLITFRDGSGGAALGYTIAPTVGGSNIIFPTGLATSPNTALYFIAATASTTIYVSCQGYYAPV